ncbi:hypothetical protein PFUGPA_05340 [Plasmodium falciparum Palo Alto/Uganda]|uniref:Uncharacterized protein n=6 Tax=Plasmodium falciparum TaxID=5833 RepID=A0A024W816_PLAFA|nr:hypothetical protein PFFVO_02272 [Plasmodium falciparum Vietnam Oak-Knoll (FVO)]ETW37044.1 hypothetical protein PFTANZ_02344 [Plasmodium falciparum Tanzania (2000708)]ETW49742.1 hypothetical protein PFMALIP_02276 [Plasmodium falciparum MaliPS096_E11]ETW52333.1 hypothetical protein PFUGPA_05340 [Plasmodium falciparum Palo Alto/Uganda]ETW62133.1 hypothetical protein PFMC_02234 [Plasmodium falciparum CAMP/Malaysia]EUR72731.1 hypothetical protein PFBG_02306 [Plasmodium falciparum 7G8]
MIKTSNKHIIYHFNIYDVVIIGMLNFIYLFFSITHIIGVYIKKIYIFYIRNKSMFNVKYFIIK